MKKTYKTIQAFIILICLISFKVGAQALSGTVTIDAGTATGGTNYQNFTDFANAVNTNGISGPLVANVLSSTGPYNEQPSFNQISGANSTNTITINGNGNLLTFNGTITQPWTMRLNGADNIYVNNLNMAGQNTTYAIVCLLTNGANNNYFSACTFSCQPNVTGTANSPVSLSASSTGNSTGANSGNNNTFEDCQMFSGYYGVYLGGFTSAPWQTGNRVIGCDIQDFYIYGMYCFYQTYATVSNNMIEKPTRTTHSTFYGLYIYYNQGTMCEGNTVQKPFDTAPTTTSTFYGAYWYSPLTPQPIPRNTYRNNVFRNLRGNGTMYGAYCYYASGDIYHNTFSFIDPTATAGTIYGLYLGGTATYTDIDVKNNLIAINRGGGTKYGMYVAAMYAGIAINGNNIHLTGSGTNIHGYLSTLGTANTFANWQGYGVDLAGANIDPIFVNNNTDNHPTNLAMDNLGLPLSVVFDNTLAVRNQGTPDMGALEFNIPNCTGTPSANTVAGANYILCPGQSASLAIGNLTNLSPSGLTYQWQSSSVSGVGPWTNIPGATGLFYNTPSTYSMTYYSVVISCGNPGGGSITPVTTLNIAAPTTSVAPYFEGFENIALNNRLPNCSWSSSSLGASAKTSTSALNANRIARTGTSFAYFDLSGGAGTNYYYTNGINLVAGITYSVSTWFQTDFTGATNWTDLSILLGTSQSPTGLVTLASTNGPAVSAIYRSLSNTFTVATSGLYYVAVRGTSSAGTAQYLTWDDLAITIPCTSNLNSPQLTVGANQSTICAGNAAILTASGANNYIWSTGATTSSVTVFPQGQTTYSVMGTSVLTGCSSSVTKVIFVNPSPSFVVFSNPPVVCSGSPANLMTSVIGGGVVNFAWSNLLTGANVVVSPTANTSYSVIATGQNGCSSSAAITVSTNPLPAINIAVSNAAICLTDNLVLTATGANNYTWLSNSSSAMLVGSQVNTTINSIGVSIFTVTGTDNNGCQNVATTNITVNACTGLSEIGQNSQMNLYPNPNTGNFTVEFGTTNNNSVEVIDMTGRLVSTSTSNSDKLEINISNYAAGVYYVKAKNANTVTTFKMIKE